jgi:hypothetical protein
MDARGVCRNDLWLVAPDYDYNRSSLGILNCDFTGGLHFGLTVQEITNTHGQPPCPRFGFQMTHLVANKNQLLVIYGGRNDTIFQYIKNLALNDICIYNIQKMTWEALAIFGQ